MNQIKVIQWYEFTGVLGGSLWILTVNLLVFEMMKRKNRASFIIFFTVAFAPIVISLIQFHAVEDEGKPVNVVILQPNIDPFTEKFDEISEKEQLTILRQLTISQIDSSAEFVIAPETTIPLIWEDNISDHPVIHFFKGIIQEFPDLKLIIGANTRAKITSGVSERLVRLDSITGELYIPFNSAILIDSSKNTGIYHKSVLVPGVEKMPYERYLPFVQKFILNLGGFSGSLEKGQGPAVFDSGNICVASVICYESLFGYYISRQVNKGAGLIFVITNDGWWKDTPGYRMHLAFSKLRAIETRRYVARSANTGVSAIIDSRGIIVNQTNWWERTTLKGKMKINEKLTFYVRNGDYIGLFAVILILIITLILLIKNFQKRFMARYNKKAFS